MSREIEERAPRTGRATTIVVVIVGLSVAMMFGLLYASTPPTVVTVDRQEPVTQQ